MRQFSMVISFVLAGSLLFGCKPDECRQMERCCEAASDLEGVGGACDDLAKNVRNPDTCRTVVQTVRYMYQDQQVADVPDVCTFD